MTNLRLKLATVPYAVQGALSGGGWDEYIQFSNDGLTRTLTYDSGLGYLWNDQLLRWENAAHERRLPSAYRNWRAGVGRWASLCPAPNHSHIIYGLATTDGRLFRSTNRMVSWEDTGLTGINSTTSDPPNSVGRGKCQPRMAVDPVNPLHVYVFGNTGVIYRTFDGFETIEVVPGAPSITGTQSFQGCVAFDPTSGTVDVDGHTVTAGIYLGWPNASSAIYESVDGGENWTATASGPPGAYMFSMAPQGVLYAAGYSNVVDRLWRYTTPTTTSGLTASTWTFINQATVAGATGNPPCGLAADPLNPGWVAAAIQSGGVQISDDYGDNWWPPAFPASTAGWVATGSTRVATDCPHLGPYVAPNTGTLENWMSVGGLNFDPVVSGRLWMAAGVGVWYMDPVPNAAVRPSTLIAYSQNKNQQGLIVDAVVKGLGSNFPLTVTTQDRAGYSLPDPDTEPQGDIGIVGSTGSAIKHGWGIDCAKDGSNFVAMQISTQQVWATTDGYLWDGVTPGFTGGHGPIAVQNASKFVIAPLGKWIYYTLDGGTTMQQCLFQGAPVSSGFTGFYWNRHTVCADWEDHDTYYATNISAKAIFTASVNQGGVGYTVGDQLCVAGQANSGGTFSPVSIFEVAAVDGSGAITSIDIFDAGYSYASHTNGATVTVSVVINADDITLASGGSGYVVGNTLTISGQTGQLRNYTGITVSAVDGSGAITAFTKTLNVNVSAGTGTPINTQADQTMMQGYGYFSANNLPSNPVNATGGAGTGAQFDLTFPAAQGASLDVIYDQLSGVWRSQDGGANWTRMYDGVFTNLGGSSLGAGSNMATLQAVKGYEGHLVYSNGTFFSPSNTHAFTSQDGGDTWNYVRGMTTCWLLTTGKAAPGQSYPALIAAGSGVDADPRPDVPGIFIADNFNPLSPTTKPTWRRLCDAPGGNVTSPSCLYGDKEVYGTAYIGMGATGYAVVRMR
jgi:hypothetical protein